MLLVCIVFMVLCISYAIISRYCYKHDIEMHKYIVYRSEYSLFMHLRCRARRGQATRGISWAMREGRGYPSKYPKNSKRPPPPGEDAVAKAAIDFCRVFCRLKRSHINGLRVFRVAMAKVFSINFPTTYFLWRVIYIHILLPLYYL